MNNILIIVNVVVLLFLMFGLFMMQKKHVSFSKRVFTGLGLGLVFGFIIHLIYGGTHEVTTQSINWFNIVGGGYVKLLQMVVMPLVFVSIVGAFTKLKLTKN
ncbi:cation:dicarboxylate symporter family transporter, partial [Neobacillus citreus]